MLAQECAAQRQRILASGARDLVKEALGGERRVGRPHRAPPLHGHGQLWRMELEQPVGNRVRQVGRAFDRGLVDAVLHHHRLERRAGEDRLPDDRVAPGDELALRIEARLERVVVHRAVVARAHVVLASPDELHRGAALDRLGDGRGFQEVIRVRVGAPAEAAASIEHVELHLLGTQVEELPEHHLVHRLELLAVPYLAALRPERDHAVHRLHRRVREERELVRRLEPLRRAAERRFDVALLVRHRARRHRKALVLGHDLRRAEAQRRGLVPLGDECVAAALGRPIVLGEHGDAVGRRRGKGDHVEHAANLFCLGRVEARELGAEARRMQYHRGQHAGQFHILGEERAARRFRLRIHARRRGLADIDEVLRILERHVGRHDLRRGGRRELAKLRALLRLAMLDQALGYRDFARRHAPALGRRADEHRARGGAGLTELLVGIRERGAAARALRFAPEEVVVALRVRGRAFDAHLRPVRIQLFGNQRRQPGVRALAHLEVLDDDGDRVVRADAHERIGLERGAALRAYLGQRHGEHQRAARLEEVAPAEIRDHAEFPPMALDARLIAARMRGYVAQRQMLPAIAASICASLGSWFAFRSAVALMICPDWQ